MKNALVILAGGKGKRFGQKKPKQFYKVGEKTIIEIFLSNLDVDKFSLVIFSINKKYIKLIRELPFYTSKKNKIVFSEPGLNRQQSSFKALKKIEKYKLKNVLIHDAARPFCSNTLINKILNKLKKFNNCIPYVEYNGRNIDKKNNKDVNSLNIQTPQGFDYKTIFNAHNNYKKFDLPDDASLLQKMKLKIYFTKGDKKNIKVTYPEDLIYFNLFKKPIYRSGIGYDIHQIDRNSKKGLKLCGISLPHPKLVGHSDADVGLHAICDSIFGALSLRDIGYYFPNTEKKWKNANSSKFIFFCKKKLLERGFYITNIDINIIAEKPKITKYVSKMKINLAKMLNIKTKSISIKATTNEKIGFIGNGEGIAAEAITQITNDEHN